jgi:predicted phosphodiesterase
MRILPLSDLHMESTRGWDLPPLHELPPFDVAVVAGDLTTRMARGVQLIHRWIPGRACLYVAGNHEHYGTDIDINVAKAREAAKGTSVLVASNDVHSIDGVDFLGCTLWTNFDLFGDRHKAMVLAGDMMNDFSKIRVDNYRRKFRPADALARHNESVAFLKNGLARSNASQKVVVTHHKPIATAGDLKAPDGYPDLIQANYCSDLTADFFVDGPDAWVFGHTHQSVDAVVGRDRGRGRGPTRLISNAKGCGPWPGRFPSPENKNFDPHFVFEI